MSVYETIEQCKQLLQLAHIEIPNYATPSGMSRMIELLNGYDVQLELEKDVEDLKLDLADLKTKVRETIGISRNNIQQVDIIEKRIADFENTTEKPEALNKTIQALEQKNAILQERLNSLNREHADISKILSLHDKPNIKQAMSERDDAHIKYSQFSEIGAEKLKAEVDQLKLELSVDTVDTEADAETDVDNDAYAATKDFDEDDGILAKKRHEIDELERQLNPAKTTEKKPRTKHLKEIEEYDHDYSYGGYEMLFNSATSSASTSSAIAASATSTNSTAKPIPTIPKPASSPSSTSTSAPSQQSTVKWSTPKYRKKETDPTALAKQALLSIMHIRRICVFFANGHCKSGSRCVYNHCPQITADMAKILNVLNKSSGGRPICIQNFLGVCTYKEICKKYHHPAMDINGTFEQRCKALYNAL